MRREDFVNEMTSWGEVTDFCVEAGLDDLIDDIYSSYNMARSMDEDIPEYLQHNDWDELKDALNNIDEGYDYYRRYGFMEWTGLDDYSDLDDFVQEVKEYIDDNCPDLWDSDEDVDEDEEVNSEEPTYAVSQETEEYISMSMSMLGVMNDAAQSNMSDYISEVSSRTAVLDPKQDVDNEPKKSIFEERFDYASVNIIM